MPGSYVLSARLSDPAVGGTAATDAPWCDDADPATAQRLDARIQAWSRALQQRLPGLSRKTPDEDDLQSLADPTLPVETAVRRAHRLVVLDGRWARGALSVRLYDRQAVLDIGIDAPDPAGAADDLTAALAALLGLFTAVTGWPAGETPEGAASSPARAAAALLSRHAGGLRRWARRRRSVQRGQAWGRPSALLLTLLAWGAAAVVLGQAFDEGSLAARTDPASTATFVTEARLATTYRAGVLPQFALQGVIAESGQRVRLPVFREEVLRAAPGARFTVLATRDADTPYLLRQAHASHQPFVRLGDGGVSWLALLALVPLGFWGVTVWRPWRRATAADRPRMLAQMTGRLLALGPLLLLLGAVLALGRLG